MRVVNVDGTNDRGVLDCLGTPGPERILGSPLGDVIAAMGGKAGAAEPSHRRFVSDRGALPPDGRCDDPRCDL